MVADDKNWLETLQLSINANGQLLLLGSWCCSKGHTWFNPEKDGSWDELTAKLLFLFATDESKH